MTKIRFAITNIWIWLIMVLACFVGENYALLTPNPVEGFDTSSILAVTLLCALAIIAFFVMERKKNNYKPNFIFLIVLTLAYVCFLVSIWIQKDQVFSYSGREVLVSISLNEKIRATIVLTISIIFLYILLHPFVLGRRTNNSFMWMHWMMILFTYATIIYSIATESQLYLKSLTQEVSIKSFYLNENAFGIGVYLALLSCAALNMYKRHWLNYVNGAVFFVMIVTIYCKTTLALGILTVFIFFFIDVITGFKKHFKSSLVVLFSGIAIFAAISALLAIGVSKEHPTALLVVKKLFSIVNINEMDTVQSRMEIWKICMENVFDSPLHLLFGRGYIIHKQYIQGATSAYWGGTGVKTAHNGFISLFMATGVMGYFVYMFIIGYFIYASMKLLTIGKFKFVITHWIYIGLLLIYSLFETHILFEVRGKEMFTSVVYFMPIIVKYHYEFKADMKPDIEVAKKHQFSAEKASSLIAIVFVALITACICILPNQYILAHPNEMEFYLFIILGLMIAFLVLPYLIYLWTKGMKPFYGSINIAINVIVITFVPMFLFFLLYQNENGKLISVIAAVSLLLISALSYAIFKKDFFRNYIRLAFYEPILACLAPMMISIVTTSVISIVFSSIMEFTALTALVFGVIGLVIFFAAITFIPNSFAQPTIKYFNEYLIVREYKLVMKGDRYA